MSVWMIKYRGTENMAVSMIKYRGTENMSVWRI